MIDTLLLLLLLLLLLVRNFENASSLIFFRYKVK